MVILLKDKNNEEEIEVSFWGQKKILGKKIDKINRVK